MSNTDFKKQLKIPWLLFIENALEKIREKYPDAKLPVFMKSHGYESDSEVYEIPEYVLINLDL